MKSLHVEIHPTKTISSKKLGKVKNGFDFLGFRTMPLLSNKESPTTIQASAESVSRRDSKVARLYEQGASKKRIGQYLRRWLGWSILSSIMAICPSHAATNPFAPSCTFGASENVNIYAPFLQSAPPTSNILVTYTKGVTSPTVTPPGSVCLTPNLPDLDDDVCEAPGFTPTNNIAHYANWTSAAGQYVYEIVVSPQGSFGSSTIVRNERTVSPTAVPIFTPIGLLVTISGLLWFGRRRKSIKITQN